MGRRRRRAQDSAATDPATAPRGEERADRKETKHDYKLDKTALKTELVKAKGTRLKWLAVVMGLGLACYFALSTGGGAGLLTKAKSLIGL